jgi:hypothetical protein
LEVRLNGRLSTRRSIVEESVRQGTSSGRDSLDRIFKDVSENGRPFVADRGGLWMDVREDDRTSQVGLSPNNVLAAGSDRAYKVILAHVSEVLKSSARRRETIGEFKETWQLLQQAHAETQTAVAMQP